MTISTRTLITVNGKSAWATSEQAHSIATLEATRKGGFARVQGYVAKSGRTVPTVYDATVTTRFSYAKLIARQAKALQAMTVQDISEAVKSNVKLSALSSAELALAFDARKASELASIQATEQGNRDDSHRQAHDRCYINIDSGIVVHLATEADSNGIKQPVLTNGFPTIDSVMLNCLEISRTVRVKGEYKTVNSGVPVLISNAIKAVMKAQGIRSMNRISLKEGNFERLAIDSEVLLPEDMVALA